MSSCTASSFWCCDPLLAAELAAEVGEELRLDRADRDPAAVPAGVHVVAGEAAGQQVVPRGRDRARREVLVQVQRHQGQHAVRHRDVEVRADTVGRPGHQCRQDRDHRVHPAARTVADRGAGQRRPAVGVAARAVEVAADREVVEVVAGPLRVRTVLAVARGRAVHDARVHVRAPSRTRCRGGRPRRAGSSRSPRPRSRRGAGTRRARSRPSGRTTRAACRGDRRTRRRGE